MTGWGLGMRKELWREESLSYLLQCKARELAATYVRTHVRTYVCKRKKKKEEEKIGIIISYRRDT